MLVQIFFSKRCERLVDFHHFIPEIVRIKDSRWFHSCKSYKLDKMILYHVAQGTRRFVEPAALLDTEVLDSCNFYVVDIVTIPERFEDTGGKTERKHVLCSFLAKKMVDTVNLVLVEDRSIDTVQLTCRFEIVTERFLDDDTRMRSI